MLPRRKGARNVVLSVLLRRRWFILLPAATGLAFFPVARADAAVPEAVAGAVGGLVLGLVLVAVLEHRRAGLSSEETVAHALMLPVLGTVSVLMSEGEWKSERFRRVAIDVVGCVVVTLAVLSAFWRLATVR